MKFHFLTLFLSISLITFSQKQANDLAKMNLKGKVVSITEKETKSPSIIPDGGQFNSHVETTSYLFNANGFITEKTNSTNNDFNSKEKNFYNSLNQISKTESYDLEGHLKDYGINQYEYDENGELSRIFDATNSSKYKSELVKKPDFDLITLYSFENDIYTKTSEKTKNKKGQTIEDKSYANNKLHIETSYSYNNKGYMSKYVFKEYWNGKINQNSQQFLYNKNNDIIKIISLDENNNIIKEENFDYQYDNVGNWITKETSGEYSIYIRRDIKYGS